MDKQLEHIIRNHFEDRTIEPSSDAWLSVQNKLADTPEEDVSSNKVLRYAIASGLVVLIALSVFLSTEEPEMVDDHIAVITTEKIVENPEITSPEISKSSNVRKSNQQNNQNRPQISFQNIEPIRKKYVENERRPYRDLTIQLGVTHYQSLAIKASKHLETNYGENQEIDREIDDLFAQAQQALNIEDSPFDSTVLIAQFLLEEVETELDPTIKQRLIAFIKQRYKKLRHERSDK